MQPLLLNVMQMQCTRTNAKQCMHMHTTCSRRGENATSRHVRGLKTAEEVSQAVLLGGMHGHVASCRREDLAGGCRLAAAHVGDLRCVLHFGRVGEAVDVCKRQT